MTDTEQLARWREATGLTTPTTVPLSCTMVAGRVSLTVTGDRFPTRLARSLWTRRPRKIRRDPLKGAAKFASIGGPTGQHREWERAITTGAWA